MGSRDSEAFCFAFPKIGEGNECGGWRWIKLIVSSCQFGFKKSTYVYFLVQARKIFTGAFSVASQLKNPRLTGVITTMWWVWEMIRILLFSSGEIKKTEGKSTSACAKCEYTAPWCRSVCVFAPKASPSTSFSKRKTSPRRVCDSFSTFCVGVCRTCYKRLV